MGWIAFVRHGLTDWNESGLLQGRTDTRLSTTGISQLRNIYPSSDFLAAHWVTSPLIRARHTATILNPDSEVEVQPALIETNWGEFEGLPRQQITRRIRELNLNPDHGIDLTPPAGESPRMVRQRLMDWVASYAVSRRALVAITHKGVIRSALSAACDWDMDTDFSRKPDWTLPQLFEVDASGDLHLMRLNCPWDHTFVSP